MCGPFCSVPAVPMMTVVVPALTRSRTSAQVSSSMQTVSGGLPAGAVAGAFAGRWAEGVDIIAERHQQHRQRRPDQASPHLPALHRHGALIGTGAEDSFDGVSTGSVMNDGSDAERNTLCSAY